jgi:hypothetical protein
MEKRYDSDIFVRTMKRYVQAQNERDAEREIATVGFRQSSDACVLFEQFVAKGLSVVPTEEDYEYLPRIPDIVERGSGNTHELAFVLVNLFTWGGVAAERVHVYGNKEACRENRDLGELEHLLVYVPALDRYFDPTLRTSAQLTETGMAPWLEERPRIYFSYPGTTGRGFFGKRSAPTK